MLNRLRLGFFLTAAVAALFDMADLSVKMLLFGMLTPLPVTVFMYRAQAGAHDSGLVSVPILLATSASTRVGFLSVAFMTRKSPCA